MKKLFGITLGILTAVGGFVDIGDLVSSSATGARFGMGLAWALLLGLVGIIVFADMAGRVAAVSQRPVFDIVRSRLGPRVGLVNLTGSMFVNFLTVVAEIAGVALAIELLSSVNYVLFIPVVAFFVWLVIWRMKFSRMETVFGVLGLALAVVLVTVLHMKPDWNMLGDQLTHATRPTDEPLSVYFYWAISLFSSAMTPYEVFFFSSGAVEEHWSKRDLSEERANVFIGFPLGALFALGLMAMAATQFMPRGIEVESLSQVALPITLQLGQVGLAFALLGFFVCTFGAALEATLSSGYSIAQYYGWPWGKAVSPRKAPRFHFVVIVVLIFGVLVGVTGIDPIQITEFSLIFAAVALPLTYLPILLVANDREYMGKDVNGWFRNLLGVIIMVVVIAAAVAALPLMIWTKAGG